MWDDCTQVMAGGPDRRWFVVVVFTPTLSVSEQVSDLDLIPDADLAAVPYESGVSPKLGKDVRRMLDQAGRLRGHRNAIIHSVWPNPTDEHAFTWRSGSPKDKGQSAAKTFVTNREELMTLITDMIKLIGDMGRLAMRARPEKFAE
jgi:hypothetical protein